jgi:hypothetical protein
VIHTLVQRRPQPRSCETTTGTERMPHRHLLRRLHGKAAQYWSVVTMI